MMKQYDQVHKSCFIKGLSAFTGIPKSKLERYANNNNLFNVLEHPYIIEPNNHQIEKINILNEFITAYKLMKLYETENILKLNSSAIAGQYFVSLLGGIKNKEKFLTAFLDNGNNIIETRVMSEGSIGETAVYPRDVLKTALDCDCKSVILAHNHPGGSLSPSKMDIDLTSKMASIFSQLQINLVDHIIVTDKGYCSMAEKGLVPIENCISKTIYEPIAINEQNLSEKYSEKFKQAEDLYSIDSNFIQREEDENEWER